MKMTKDREIDYLNKVAKSYKFYVGSGAGRLDGYCYIKKIRKYEMGNKYRPYTYQVDFVFVGKIFARVDSQSTWLTNEIMTRKNISKIKVNRMIRREIETSFRNRCGLFNISAWDFDVKKVEWLENYTPKV